VLYGIMIRRLLLLGEVELVDLVVANTVPGQAVAMVMYGRRLLF